jgi:hypothetical protein
MKATREFLAQIGLPCCDAYNLPTSDKRFSDGAQYRFEVPAGIQGPIAMKSLLEEIDGLNLTIHRVTQTKGIMLLTDNEIVEMVILVKQAQRFGVNAGRTAYGITFAWAGANYQGN